MVWAPYLVSAVHLLDFDPALLCSLQYDFGPLILSIGLFDFVDCSGDAGSPLFIVCFLDSRARHIVDSENLQIWFNCSMPPTTVSNSVSSSTHGS